MAEQTEPSAEAVRRFLTFRMGERLYALPAEDVAEVIRLPHVARVPQSPKGLLGIANLRGAVLPIASLRGLLGQLERAADEFSRAIVIEGAAPIALAVDAVQALVAIDPGRVETRQAELSSEPGEELRGAFPTGAHNEVAKILDLQHLLRSAFVPRERKQRSTLRSEVSFLHEDASRNTDHELLVTFEVAGQEFGLALGAINEIVPAPDNIAIMPRAEAVVIGVTAFRQTLLPLLSLRGLLGFAPAAQSDGREKVLVTTVRDVTVGLVVDRMRSIVSAAPELVDSTPSVLAARVGGEARIKAIYRGDDGRRLISILEPEQLFREDVMNKLGRDRARGNDAEASELERGKEVRFVVFRLGDDEFGLPIDTVDEVAEVPGQITRVPKTPKFLEGVVNLRGEVLPVVDQRRRFDMPKIDEGGRRRLVVVRTSRHRAGIIVDSVSEVLRSYEHAIEPAPDLAGEQTRLVNGVINLEDNSRIVLLLDPAELLSRAERELLDKLQTKVDKASV